MGRMDHEAGLRENELPLVSDVRVERAGVFGLTSCKFDEVTGEHLSTTRPVEINVGFLGMMGIPGEVIDQEVDCPRWDSSKCGSCTNRKPEIKDRGENASSMSPEQLANAQQLHGTLHGFN